MTQLNKNDSVKKSVLSTYWFNNYDIDIASGNTLKPVCFGVVLVSFGFLFKKVRFCEQHPNNTRRKVNRLDKKCKYWKENVKDFPLPKLRERSGDIFVYLDVTGNRKKKSYSRRVYVKIMYFCT